MRRPTRAVAVLGLVVGAAALCGCASEQRRDGVLIHVTAGQDDPHRVLTALLTAENLAKDMDVLVYFDVRGVEVALRESKNLSFHHLPFSRDQIRKLANMGIPVLACPDSLVAIGKSEADLMPGVKPAKPGDLHSFTRGRFLTLDY